jgi:hypothetical protein
MSAVRIRDWYRARPGYWFRPKLFGWGAVPVTWQGWAATLLLIAVSVPIAMLAANRGMAYLALTVPLIVGYVWLCWVRTDGDWRWRWGQGDAS